MNIDEALKWTDVWRLAEAEAPSGNAAALAALAAEVRRLRGLVGGEGDLTQAMIDEIERLRAFVAEVRRSGDTRLASMAIAVLSVTPNAPVHRREASDATGS